MKKPAMVKTKPWQDVPYTPKNALVDPRGLRKDQANWKCTLSGLLKADNKGIVKLLVRDKLLIDMTGVTCPTCGKGTLSKLTKCQGDRWKHKCSSRNCRVWLNPHHLHPLFVDGWGNSAKSSQTQSTLLLLLLRRIPQSKIHMLMDINHKAVEEMHRKLCLLRQEYVESKQKSIIFGNGTTWADVEADEATFDRRDISNDSQWKHLVKTKDSTMLLGYTVLLFCLRHLVILSLRLIHNLPDYVFTAMAPRFCLFPAICGWSGYNHNQQLDKINNRPYTR